jgi:Asp-tRNA(Asn)/Glu-tRNA(Gln) amidotransferase A subunit family amidase
VRHVSGFGHARLGAHPIGTLWHDLPLTLTTDPTPTPNQVRIPSALCGTTGFKPTAARVPRDGAFPLSYTLDSVGPLANSVACCALFDAILAAERPAALAASPPPLPVERLQLLLPRCGLFDDVEPVVSAAFEAGTTKANPDPDPDPDPNPNPNPNPDPNPIPIPDPNPTPNPNPSPRQAATTKLREAGATVVHMDAPV